MSVRTWVSIITLIFLGLVIYFGRHEIITAWKLLGEVNLLVLSLIIPAQIVVYFIAGEMMFVYLRDKKSIDHISIFEQARMALEMNFVNHTLPSAGVSGITYMTWRLSKFGISAGRATLAQLVRYVASFAAFTVLLILALVAITIDGDINRWMILLSSITIFIILASTALGIFLVSSPARSRKFSNWLVSVINKLIYKVTKKKELLSIDRVIKFFRDMHSDYVELRNEKKILLKPFLWGIAFTIGDVMLYMIVFWALGTSINPAPLLMAYGIAILAGFIVVTPGGAGVFEAIMVSFLLVAGVNPGVTLAGILLTRVLVLLGTIGFGYIFYQHALVKYGKSRNSA
ncbi:flippase-like domain-containing protein [Candidatus Saccharibacteria bacterium]|nr:flippase-like domain-containing protein [Candidatus Saccharibacteria bacterium]